MSELLPSWLQCTADGIALLLHVQPGAKRTELVGVHGDALKLRLAAPPVEGRANAALIDALARGFCVSRQSVRLVSGESARRKRVEVLGVTSAAALAWLEQNRVQTT